MNVKEAVSLRYFLIALSYFFVAGICAAIKQCGVLTCTVTLASANTGVPANTQGLREETLAGRKNGIL